MTVLAAPSCNQNTPVDPEPQELSFRSVSAAVNHTCGVTTDNRAFCWGDNSAGQLGTDAFAVVIGSIPVAVAGNFQFSSVTAGDSHTCAITTGADVHCWGTDLNGRAPAPRPLAGSVRLTAISAGSFHTCGVDSGAAAYCWGLGGTGQLGTGLFGAAGISAEPTLVSGQLEFASVSAGETHSCGVTTDAQAYCWGTNASGQIGEGKTTSGPCVGSSGATYSCMPVPTLVAGGIDWQSVTTGSRHSCGIASDGRAYCWGDNRGPQLGTSATSQTCSVENGALPDAPCATTPIQVSSTLTWSMLDAGTFHTCGITDQRAAYCWGNGQVGQLGDGSNGQSTTPSPVASDLEFATVSAGHLHTCGVTTAGEAYCWGSNDEGQLGNTEGVVANAPVKVAPALLP